MVFRGNRGRTMWTSKALGSYNATNEDIKAAGWCLTNNIHIYIHCYEPFVYHLAVRINGKEKISPETYSSNEVLKKKYEFFKYYYNKYKLNTNDNG